MSELDFANEVASRIADAIMGDLANAVLLEGIEDDLIEEIRQSILSTAEFIIIRDIL